MYMRKINLNLYAVITLALILICSCSKTQDWEWSENGQPIIPGQGEGGSSSNDGIAGTLLDFDILIDEADMTGDDFDETIITDKNADGYDDFVENSTFTKTVTLYYNGNSVNIGNDVDGVTIEANGAHVVVNSTVKEVEYVLSGSTTNGSFKMYSSNKYKLTLGGVSITNPTGAAINIQSKKRVFVVLEDGTENNLTDGTSYTTIDGEDMKACFFSEAQLIFSGKGALNIAGLYRHALCSDDYIRFRKGVKLNIRQAVKDGIHTNEGVIIGGGILNIQATDDGIQSEDGDIVVTGGRTTVLTTGNGVYEDNDISSSSAINGGAAFTMTNGTVLLKSTGSAGKGLNVDGDINIDKGTLRVITTGKQYVYQKLDSSAKGVKSKANVTINGGTIWVKATGDEGSEGIESKATMTINGGDIAVYAYDDAINASNHIEINGGNIYCYSIGNDGIDSNGTITINGGVVVASGTTSPEDGIDCDQNTFKITGGVVLGIGGSTSMPTSSACTQRSVVYGASGTAGQYISIQNSSNESVLTYQIPRTYSKMTLLFSSPKMQTGDYIVYTGGSVEGGTSFYGLYTDAVYQSGTKATTFSASSMVTSVGNVSSGGGGGNRPW